MPDQVIFIHNDVIHTVDNHAMGELIEKFNAAESKIQEKWQSLGGAPGAPKVPGRSGQIAAGQGYYREYVTGARIYYSEQGGAIHVYGAIGEKYNQFGAADSLLGWPLHDEYFTADGGSFLKFENGAIYWHPTTGAHAIYGSIRQCWADHGWERSSLGYPTSDEMPAPDGVGRINYFQNGLIYWSIATGAYVVPKFARLDLRIHAIREYDSNDTFLQGATDEVHAARGVALDSAEIYLDQGDGKTKMPDHNVSITDQDLTQNGDVSFPINVYSFDLLSTKAYPRTCMVTLYVIEEDNESLAEDYAKLDNEFRGRIKTAVAEKGAALLAEAGAAIAGEVGAFIGQQILGRVWAYLSGEGIDAISNAIHAGLANDFMPPFIFKTDFPVGFFSLGNVVTSSGLLTLDYRGTGGAHYGIDYEWVLS